MSKVTKKNAPEQQLSEIAKQAPQVHIVQVPGVPQVPSDTPQAPGLSAIFTPQFADALAAHAAIPHPGENGMSGVLKGLVSAHQQIDTTNATNRKQRMENRKSLLKQQEGQQSIQQKTLDRQEKAAATLLSQQNYAKAVQAQQEGVQVRKDAIAQQAQHQREQAQQEQQKLLAEQHKAEVAARSKHYATMVSRASKTTQEMLRNLQKVSKPNVDVNGRPLDPTPSQKHAILAATKAYHQAKATELVATAKDSLYQTLQVNPEWLQVNGVDASQTQTAKTLPTVLTRHKNNIEAVTVLLNLPGFVRLATQDTSTGNITIEDITPNTPHGAEKLRQLEDTPGLGVHFDPSLTTIHNTVAPALDLSQTPPPLPKPLRGRRLVKKDFLADTNTK